jgi:hypothetical protein
MTMANLLPADSPMSISGIMRKASTASACSVTEDWKVTTSPLIGTALAFVKSSGIVGN